MVADENMKEEVCLKPCVHYDIIRMILLRKAYLIMMYPNMTLPDGNNSFGAVRGRYDRGI